MRDMISARVTLLAPEKGGRSTPLFTGAYKGTYRPHIVIGDPDQRQPVLVEKNGLPNFIDETYLGVAFWDGPKDDPLPTGEPMEIVLVLIYEPSSMYDEVVPGAMFTLREGGKIVGFGEITCRWREEVSR